MVENPLRVVSARRMSRVRLVMHHALQLVVAPLGAPAPLTWSESTGALWGARLEGRQAGLRFAPVQLVFRVGDQEEAFGLAHQTMEVARAWLASRWGHPIAVPHGLPHHAVRSGGRFPGESRASLQLEQEFAGAAQLLEALGAETGGLEPVTVSASSFAMTTALPLRSRSVTVGFSPGDAESDESYWFIQAPQLHLRAQARLPGVGPLDREVAPAAVTAVRAFIDTSLAALQRYAEP